MIWNAIVQKVESARGLKKENIDRNKTWTKIFYEKANRRVLIQLTLFVKEKNVFTYIKHPLRLERGLQSQTNVVRCQCMQRSIL